MIDKKLRSSIRRFFWGLILTQVPFLSNGQVFNELSTTLSLNNPAYHSDLTVHGKGFLSSDLKANTSIYFSTGANFVVSQNFLRYQLGLGKWKMGVNNFHVGALGQNTFSYGFNLSRDIAINRDINLRVVANQHQILLSSNWQRNLLSNGEQFNIQLGYHWKMCHRPTLQRFTGTPSF